MAAGGTFQGKTNLNCLRQKNTTETHYLEDKLIMRVLISAIQVK